MTVMNDQSLWFKDLGILIIMINCQTVDRLLAAKELLINDQDIVIFFFCLDAFYLCCVFDYPQQHNKLKFCLFHFVFNFLKVKNMKMVSEQNVKTSQ